jgi:hypothetical protein
MKKIVILLILVVLSGTPLLAVDYTSYQQGFQKFADGVANALPFNSSLGLNYDAWKGSCHRVGHARTRHMGCSPPCIYR